MLWLSILKLICEVGTQASRELTGCADVRLSWRSDTSKCIHPGNVKFTNEAQVTIQFLNQWEPGAWGAVATVTESQMWYCKRSWRR